MAIDILTLGDGPPPGGERTVQALEAGGLLVLPHRPFHLQAEEAPLIDPAVLDGRRKNVSLDPATGEVRGAAADGGRRAALGGLLARFATTADALVAELAPRYAPALQRRRTSFRPGAVATRALSPRKDDRRLHVDAFPSNPTGGRRILRVFANVDPQGRPRVWDVGEEDFEATARRFRPRLTARGRTAGLKARLGLTRGRQSAYDQVMLQLHDSAKLDDAYQAQAPRRRLEFPAGSMWMVCTDQVSHAALGGQHAFEQTYLMPVEAMAAPERSPLRTLERVLERPLV